MRENNHAWWDMRMITIDTDSHANLLHWINGEKKRTGLTDGDIAMAIGRDRTSFNRLRRGTREASFGEVAKLAAIFNSDPPIRSKSDSDAA